MKLQDVGPLGAFGSFGTLDQFPSVPMGKVTRVEPIRTHVRGQGPIGVTVHFEHEGHQRSASFDFRDKVPSVDAAIKILTGHVGEDIADLLSAELEQV